MKMLKRFRKIFIFVLLCFIFSGCSDSVLYNKKETKLYTFVYPIKYNSITYEEKNSAQAISYKDDFIVICDILDGNKIIKKKEDLKIQKTAEAMHVYSVDVDKNSFKIKDNVLIFNVGANIINDEDFLKLLRCNRYYGTFKLVYNKDTNTTAVIFAGFREDLNDDQGYNYELTEDIVNNIKIKNYKKTKDKSKPEKIVSHENVKIKKYKYNGSKETYKPWLESESSENIASVDSSYEKPLLEGKWGKSSIKSIEDNKIYDVDIKIKEIIYGDKAKKISDNYNKSSKYVKVDDFELPNMTCYIIKYMVHIPKTFKTSIGLGVISDVQSVVLMPPDGDPVPYFQGNSYYGLTADQVEDMTIYLPVVPAEISDEMQSFTNPGMINKEKTIAFYVPKEIVDFDIVFGENNGKKTYVEIENYKQKSQYKVTKK